MIKKFFLIATLCLVISSSLVLDISSVEAQAPSQAFSIIEQFSVARGGDILLLPVMIEGKRFSFVLDTGCAQSALDSSTFDLGKPRTFKRFRTPNGVIITVPQHAGPQMLLGNMRLPNRPVITADFAMLRKVTGQDIRGFLGMDYLKDFVCRIDFDSGTVQFLRNRGPQPGLPVRISREEDGPFVQARISGIGPVKFLIDTGYGGRGSGDLVSKLMKELLARKQAIKANETLGTDVSGTIETSLVAKLDNFTIGEISHRQLVFSQGTMNLLSLTYLSRYIVTFDFPNNMMYLQKGKTFSDPDLLDMSGLHILREEGKTVIAKVDRGSPADAVGIIPGDMIVTTAGKPADQISLFQLRRGLCNEGQRVSLTIRRGDRDIETALLLKAWW